MKSNKPCLEWQDFLIGRRMHKDTPVGGIGRVSAAKVLSIFSLPRTLWAPHTSLDWTLISEPVTDDILETMGE